MSNPLALELALALGIPALLGAASRLDVRKRLARICRRLWLKAHKLEWDTHRLELDQIAGLRRDLDGCLLIIDHMLTPGAGDCMRQQDYARSVLAELGKLGVWQQGLTRGEEGAWQ